MTAQGGAPRCDFCGAPPAWYYPCRDFNLRVDAETRVYHYLSESGWGACQACSDLVDADRYDELVERVATLMLERFPASVRDATAGVIRQALASTYAQFRVDRNSGQRVSWSAYVFRRSIGG